MWRSGILVTLLVGVIYSDCPSSCCSSSPKMFQIQEDKCILTKSTQGLVSKIIKEMSKTGDSNLFISPFSIMNILQMILLGAVDETQRLLSTALSTGAIDVHEAAKCITDEVTKYTGYTLNYTNIFFVSSYYKGLYEDYKTLASKYYLAEFYNCKFKSRTETARRRVNSIVKNKSNDRITELFGPGSVSGATQVLIVNTVFFNRGWKVKFDSDLTANDTFYSDGSTEYTTDFMRLTGNISFSLDTSWYDTAGNDDFRQQLEAVDLPYESSPGDPSEYGMLAIKYLPEHKFGDLGLIENYVANEGILAIRKLLSERVVELYFPKFKMEYARDFKDVFTPETGLGFLFSSRANYANFAPDIVISNIVHKATIEVNEEGTVAAAATGGTFETRQAKTMVFNSPFVFYIYHSCDGLVLFQGRYMYPPTEKN